MGERKLKDMTMRPLTTLTNLTPGMVTAGLNVNALGRLPLGNYKGAVAFWDLDLAVVQPLVYAEQLHILGIVDGREEDYDLQTLTITVAEAAGTAHIAQLAVPTGEVWFLNNILTTIAASGGANIITANWYCSIWTDRIGALGYGQPFHAAAFDFGVGGGAQLDEYSPPAPLWLVTNKQVPLRAPAGTIFTVVFTNTGVVAAATVNCTFQLYGWIGKTLVA